MRAQGRQREHSMYFNEHQHPTCPERIITTGAPACLARSGTRTGVAVIVRCDSDPPPCAPLHSHYRSFLATMGALTPAHPGSSGLPSMNSISLGKQVSLIHALSLPLHSVSNHLTPPCGRFCTLPLSAPAFPCGFRLRHYMAGSSNAPGRIEFVTLRTGRSPPAAPHLASRRRSCSQLQARRAFRLKRTFTSLTKRLFRRTMPPLTG